jgi:predicted transcriptional regulator
MTARERTMEAVMDVLSVDEGKEFEVIMQETGMSKSTIWSVLGELKADGIVIIVGHRKTTPNGKRAIYALAKEPKLPADDRPMKRIIDRIKNTLAAEAGHFAVLAAQVTAD